jgi:hypothetical protein
MEQVYNQVNLSMILLKSVGGLLLLSGAFYLFKIRPTFLPQWRRVVGIGCVYGILNAGLVILLGQIAYFATPILVVTFIGLFFFDKFPLYQLKYFAGFLTTFIFSSVAFFVGIAGIFFHFAVEGKI